MVKRFSKLLMSVLVLAIAFLLVGCNDNQEKADWAERIDNRYAKYNNGDVKTPYMYEALLADTNEKFGASNYGTVVNEDIQGATCILYWIDGDYTTEEIAARASKGKKMKGLAISFAAGIAVDAYYGDLKGWLY